MIKIVVGDCRDVLRTLPDESVHCVVTTEQAAYFAGLIDGEGSLECQKQMHGRAVSPRYVIRLSFVMATAEPLQTVAGWVGLAPKCYPARTANRQPRWRLHIPKGKLVPLLHACLPYLILKRAQAEAILNIEKVRILHAPAWRGRGTPAVSLAGMEAHHRELRSLKSNKRPLACR